MFNEGGYFMSELTKERFLDICRFKSPGDLCLVDTYLNELWPQTIIAWIQQGAPDFFIDLPRAKKYFGFETVRWLREINSGLLHGTVIHQHEEAIIMDYGTPISPPFEYQVIREDERTLTFINPNGQTVKVLKDNPGSMPMYVDWPIKDRASWKEFRKRLDPTTPERYPDNWNVYIQNINNLKEPVVLEVGGFFGYMREWVGSEKVFYLFHDDPNLVEDIMDTLLEMEIEIIQRVANDIKFEMATYWEDMAFKSGPLISPDMFRKFMMPRYKKINELLHNMGVDIIFVDSDGNLDMLIPLWLECGVNFVWPLEVAAGNDAVALRKRYGTDLIMGGNIDKRALAMGKEATKKEVMSKVPFLLEKGGYFPSVDHLVPPDVPFENYCYYINLLREIAGMAKLRF
jgi:uroporphyrinogen decarboxylase